MECKESFPFSQSTFASQLLVEVVWPDTEVCIVDTLVPHSLNFMTLQYCLQVMCEKLAELANPSPSSTLIGSLSPQNRTCRSPFIGEQSLDSAAGWQ